jgi:hypothetical protein
VGADGLCGKPAERAAVGEPPPDPSMVRRGSLSERTGSTLRVTGLCIGRKEWLAHFGLRSHDQHTVVPWQAVVKIEAKRVIIRDDAAGTN